MEAARTSFLENTGGDTHWLTQKSRPGCRLPVLSPSKGLCFSLPCSDQGFLSAGPCCPAQVILRTALSL